MRILQILQRPINQGPYAGMVETITNEAEESRKMLCYFCGIDPGSFGVWSIIGDREGNAYCARCLCVTCAHEHINGIPERAGRNPFKSLDPHKEYRRMRDLKKRAFKKQSMERRKEVMVDWLAKLIIGFACMAGASFIVCISYVITKIFIGK